MFHNALSIVHNAQIPSIPQVLQKILLLVNNPDTSLKKLEHYISQEPALAAQLLKTVNSAAYGVRGKVTSVSHSLILLGFSTVKSIISGMILFNSFQSLSDTSKDFVYRIWKHSLGVSALMKIVMKRKSIVCRDEYLLSALIEDIGYLVLRQYFDKEYDLILKHSKYPTVEIERRILNTDHVEVGSYLLVEWGFGNDLIEIVYHHHDIENYKGNKEALYCIRLCDELLKQDNLTIFLNQSEHQVDPTIIDILAKINWRWKDLLQLKDTLLEADRSIRYLLN